MYTRTWNNTKKKKKYWTQRIGIIDFKKEWKLPSVHVSTQSKKTKRIRIWKTNNDIQKKQPSMEI